MSNPFRASALAAVLCIGTFQFQAKADFTDDFESYPSNNTLPSPWYYPARIGQATELTTTPPPSGYNGSGQGATGNSGSWAESARVTNWDNGQTEFQLQWSARLLARAGAIPRLNLGIFGTASGSGQFLYFEMNGLGNVLDIATSDGAVGQITGIQRDTWYRMTVTLTDDGGGSWSWSGDLEVDSGGSFVPAGSLGSGPLPTGFTPEVVDLNSITAFIEGPTSSEMSAIDDVSFLSGPQDPPPTVVVVPSTNVTGASAAATEFQSENNVIYNLLSSLDLLDTNIWQGTGAQAVGDGTSMQLFDADTAPDSKSYRVVQEL
jgi:hypothetical protein